MCTKFGDNGIKIATSSVFSLKDNPASPIDAHNLFFHKIFIWIMFEGNLIKITVFGRGMWTSERTYKHRHRYKLIRK